MTDVLLVVFKKGIIPALILAAVLTVALQPLLRRALFPKQEKITTRERAVASGFVAISIAFLVLLSFAVALGIIELSFNAVWAW